MSILHLFQLLLNPWNMVKPNFLGNLDKANRKKLIEKFVDTCTCKWRVILDRLILLPFQPSRLINIDGWTSWMIKPSYSGRFSWLRLLWFCKLGSYNTLQNQTNLPDLTLVGCVRQPVASAHQATRPREHYSMNNAWARHSTGSDDNYSSLQRKQCLLGSKKRPLF